MTIQYNVRQYDDADDAVDDNDAFNDNVNSYADDAFNDNVMYLKL